MKKAKNRKGFTLIELVIVIAILGILAVIAIPRMTSLTGDAQRSACLANQATIESAYAIAIAQGKTDPSLQDLVDDKYLNGIPKCPNGGDYVVTNGVCTCTKPEHAKVISTASPSNS